MFSPLFVPSIASIPISITIAITRYRLFEIDRIISRTLSYALIVVILRSPPPGYVTTSPGAYPTNLSNSRTSGPRCIGCSYSLFSSPLVNPLNLARPAVSTFLKHPENRSNGIIAHIAAHTPPVSCLFTVIETAGPVNPNTGNRPKPTT